MEQYVLRVSGSSWTYLGGNADAKQPLELVVRAFDGDALCAAGENERAPDTNAIAVPRGEGRRVVGRHFFARPASASGAVLISHRGCRE